ncbi:MAG: response regulator transcription factor [Bacteroidota bacterium]|nr:response regulator transcription factor [Bacteroidota bacterium]
MKILLVEDEPKVASFIKKGMEEQSYTIDVAYDGTTGRSMLLSNTYDVIIMDVNLPGINGYELAKIARAEKIFTPMIMLTALGTTDDKIAGFDSGTDMYMVKPFEFRELLSRIRALQKRGSDNSNSTPNILKVADLELDMDLKVARRGGHEIPLTAKEFALMEYFIKNKGKVVSRVDIAEKVWEINFDTGTNVIDVYVNFLRKKIDKEFPKKLINTVIGMGYILKD